MKARIAVLVAVCLCGIRLLPASAQEAPLELSLTGITDGSRPHERIAVGLKIANDSDHDIVIQRGIEIDSVGAFKWEAKATIEAVAECSQYDNALSPHAPVRIQAGSEMTIAPWHGWTCGAGRQCEESCSGVTDTPLGPGNYRFVVVTSEGKRLPSPSFRLPG